MKTVEGAFQLEILVYPKTLDAPQLVCSKEAWWETMRFWGAFSQNPKSIIYNSITVHLSVCISLLYSNQIFPSTIIITVVYNFDNDSTNSDNNKSNGNNNNSISNSSIHNTILRILFKIMNATLSIYLSIHLSTYLYLYIYICISMYYLYLSINYLYPSINHMYLHIYIYL